MTRKVETEAHSPAPGGAAEDRLQVDTYNNSSNEATSGSNTHNTNRNSGSEGSTNCDPETKSILKYALRPRSLNHRNHHQFDEADVDCDFPPKRKTNEGRRRGRPSNKPRILSRYRRKNANARERDRMRQINTAFEALQGILPVATSPVGPGSPRGRVGGVASLTKITTLRLAAGYIQALQDILDADERGETPNNVDSAYSWLLSSLLQEDEDEEDHQDEETTDPNAWAQPYLLNVGKRSLPTDIPKVETSWPYGGSLHYDVDPPQKRLKHEPQYEYSEDPNDGKVAFIYTESTDLEFVHLSPYPIISDSDTINLLLD
ncbi:unnamed protein product [Meganyctiphanes norvegica]|uniref:BHLH domain-containing protein n=1 Tax=Meganyctiphanes norvegica TaxID=48144 RepID=A0AAV2SQZ0_MEGNR